MRGGVPAPTTHTRAHAHARTYTCRPAIGAGGHPPGGGEPGLRSQGCTAWRRACRRSALSAAAGLRVYRVCGAPDSRARSAAPGQLARARDAAAAGCELAARRMEGRTPPCPVLPRRTPTFSSRKGRLATMPPACGRRRHSRQLSRRAASFAKSGSMSRAYMKSI
jgi:hypothetical protein